VSKQAFCYVLDRTTGEPVWPIKEREVPKSKTPGEQSWPTQPFPSKPAPYDRQGLQEDDLINFTPELREKALAILQRYEHGPLFTPPSEKGTLVLPGGLGGSDWSGAALVPKKNVLYVPSRTRPDIVRLEKVEGLRT
ncbi:MAG: pyrroloquinoline quinone-dependent dehydrogenase, partial [Candidatus Latescibacteria bacterium]|nr:pyrroloquinoline quinone-dependent dehydrogenase [Candidatus Latescibacterota bacterium]